MMKLAFHSNQLQLRGTEIALYDYAHYAEKLLGYHSFIVSPKNGNHSEEAIAKFKARFEVFFYESIVELESILESKGATAMYAIKAGHKDGLLPKGVKNWVHVVFRNCEPHGDVYAYISAWLAQDQGGLPWVPHIVTRPHSTETNMREALHIPQDALVFGWYGGATTFDIAFVKRVLVSNARRSKQHYFIYMGANLFGIGKDLYRKSWQNKLLAALVPQRNLDNLIFLPPSSDLEHKQRFINSCDAMIHARAQGESFGLAIGEFSASNKPVICHDAVGKDNEKAHLQILGDKGIYYHNAQQLKNIIMQFLPTPNKDWNAYREYAPEPVMAQFKRVFVEGKPS